VQVKNQLKSRGFTNEDETMDKIKSASSLKLQAYENARQAHAKKQDTVQLKKKFFDIYIPYSNLYMTGPRGKQTLKEGIKKNKKSGAWLRMFFAAKDGLCTSFFGKKLCAAKFNTLAKPAKKQNKATVRAEL